jgi:hypothetical protein
VKERPILFSSPMVRAILAGTKTQTRRLVKPVRGFEHNNVCRPDMAADSWAVWWHGEFERVGCLQTCPYGVPGDRLWVRETWQENTPPSGYIYRADDVAGHIDSGWRPSIFMPREACRLRLEVTDVRVQRLQDISEQDAKAEGVPTRTYTDGRGFEPATLGFRYLWDSINAKRAAWDSNPWVWALTFRRAA